MALPWPWPANRLVLLTALLACALVAGPAQAATFTVSFPGSDQGDAFPGDGVCDSNGEIFGDQCTLRAAVDETNALNDIAPSHTINVPAGTYTLSNGPLTVTWNLDLVGAGARRTIIKQSGVARVLELNRSTVNISGFTIRDGTANETNDYFGGNIQGVNATVTIADSTITNGSGSSAGGIANRYGDVTVRNSTIAGNRADTGGGDAGAILNFGNSDQTASLTVENSTISDNSARLGGGIFSYGNFSNSVTLLNSTVASNVSGDRGGGGGLLIGDGTATVENSIVALNSSVSVENQDCSTGQGSIASRGFNLESATDCGFRSAGDQQNTDPKLGPLQDNGGPTDTRALLVDSPAIDKGNTETCLRTDQRGVPRPQGLECDIGAYELTLPDTSIDSGPTGTTTDNTPTFGFSSPDPTATFECRVYSGTSRGAFAPCSSPYTTAALADGSYVFEVRARDTAGNVDPTPDTRAFTVDTAAPDTAIDSPPPQITRDRVLSFSFSSNEAGTTFECSFDGTPFPEFRSS